jgi:hypothetical protein
MDTGADDGADDGSETSSVTPAQSPAESVDTNTPDPPERGELADQVFDYLEETDSPPKTQHGRLAIVDVFALLREHGTLSTGEIQERVYPHYDDHWGRAKVMWESLSRYFENVPGIEKGGYGEWTYSGDDEVQEVLRRHEHDRL